jgi:hypothetical protein
MSEAARITKENPLMTAAAVAAGIVPPRAVRPVAFALTLILGVAMSTATPSVAQQQPPTPPITGVMVLVTVKPGITREQVMAVMPDEVRQTTQLYLNGKIREWYSRGDGRGVVLLLETKDVAEARTIMDGLPLGQKHLVDDEFIPVGPLMPLRFLMAQP